MTEPTKTLVNRAITRMREQDQLAYNSDKEVCQLRTPDGLSCAVGQLIDDEHYRLHMEKAASPKNPESGDIRMAITLSNPDLKLDPYDFHAPYWTALSKMQEVHDNCDTVEDFVWATEMRLNEDMGITL